MKKYLWLVLAFSLLLLLGACASTPSSTSDSSSSPAVTEIKANEPLTLRLGHIATETNPMHEYSLKFKELVEEKTEGRVEVKLFPNGQLGGNRELLESMQFGNLDLGVITTAPISNFVNDFGVLDVPFIFEDWEHMERYIQSAGAKDLLAKTSDVGIKSFALAPLGFRNVTNSKQPIVKPDDLKGIRIRVIESEVYLDTFNDLGATPTAMPWGEAFTALQQGAIDAQENDLSVIYSQNVFDVQKYVSLTEHIFSFYAFMASEQAYTSWPEDIQQAIAEAAEETTHYMTNKSKADMNNYRDLLIEKGMEFNDVDKEAFKQGVSITLEKYKTRYGEELFTSIENVK